MSVDETVPIDTVLVKTASRCNIACSYCYVYQLGDQGWRRQPPTMSRSTIDAIVRRLDELRQAQDRDFAVVLHGGEPLLLEEALLQRLLTRLRARLPAGCTLSVQTNGTLISDRRLDILADSGATVSVSLDGPAKVNDSRRVRFDQGGTFKATLDGIYRLQRHSSAEQLFSGTLSVVEPSSDPNEVYWFLRRLGVPGMSFLLPDGNHSRLPQGKAATESHEAGTWLARLFDIYMSDPDPVPIRVLDDLVKLMLGGSATKEGMGQDPSAIIIIDSDGTTGGQIAQAEQVTPATITRVLDGLDESGFIVREPSQRDRRIIDVKATEAGRAAFRAAEDSQIERLAGELATLNAEDRASVSRAIRHLEQVFQID